MNDEVRDLGDYVANYHELPFEDVMVRLRREVILERVAMHRPSNVLEIGCGAEPLFRRLTDVPMTVIEPAEAFAESARRLARGMDGVSVVTSTAEDAPADVDGSPFDLIVVASLLHEVPDPALLIRSLSRWCHAGTVVHFNVPNAGSVHRRLGVAMGVLESTTSQTAMQRRMQQRRAYDLHALQQELQRSGLVPREWGGLLLKPFGHAQMQQMIDHGVLTSSALDGLVRLGREMPELSAEIWVEAELA